jgi:AraC family transcriptional regulator of adaptative response/methylated-DNA-[protein]-cysteine methyltransferase
MSDYDRIARAIAYIVAQAGCQPTLAAIAAHVHLSPFHFQRLFSRWAGVSPKRLMQVLTVEHAKSLLSTPVPLLEVAAAVGLSSPSRLYDSFISIEAVTPGEFRRRGHGLDIEYGCHDTPFGPGFLASTSRGICAFSFLEDGATPAQPLADLESRWPQARLRENRAAARARITAMFAEPPKPGLPLPLLVSGTNFQVRVWKALLQIPPGRVASYTQIARALGHPQSARAVGNAVAGNPVGFLIPCHRVLRGSGCIGGYRWGEIRKHALYAWESARNPLP